MQVDFFFFFHWLRQAIYIRVNSFGVGGVKKKKEICKLNPKKINF